MRGGARGQCGHAVARKLALSLCVVAAHGWCTALGPGCLPCQALTPQRAVCPLEANCVASLCLHNRCWWQWAGPRTISGLPSTPPAYEGLSTRLGFTAWTLITRSGQGCCWSFLLWDVRCAGMQQQGRWDRVHHLPVRRRHRSCCHGAFEACRPCVSRIPNRRRPTWSPAPLPRPILSAERHVLHPPASHPRRALRQRPRVHLCHPPPAGRAAAPKVHAHGRHVERGGVWAGRMARRAAHRGPHRHGRQPAQGGERWCRAGPGCGPALPPRLPACLPASWAGHTRRCTQG